jgi:hypothetical protein
MAKAWNQTRVSEVLGIEYPIIQGPLGGRTKRIAVGTHITMRPPHKTGRAAFPHPAPTSDM